MARMTGGEAVVAALLHVGIDTVFGIPGVHSGGLYDALYGCLLYTSPSPRD